MVFSWSGVSRGRYLQGGNDAASGVAVAIATGEGVTFAASAAVAFAVGMVLATGAAVAVAVGTVPAAAVDDRLPVVLSLADPALHATAIEVTASKSRYTTRRTRTTPQ
jgi:hypothetical protein